MKCDSKNVHLISSGAPRKYSALLFSAQASELTDFLAEGEKGEKGEKTFGALHYSGFSREPMLPIDLDLLIITSRPSRREITTPRGEDR